MADVLEVTPDNLVPVLENLVALLKKDPELLEGEALDQLAFELDMALDDLHEDDFFGTDGALDPRHVKLAPAKDEPKVPTRTGASGGTEE